jgi:hypothetical protein
MKLNKWTVGLAAVGLVSLNSAARAEEKGNVIQTALASTTISGYVDTSAQWNFGTGNQHLPDYKFGGPTKADGFNLDVVQLRIEKPLDEAEWAAGYRVDLWFGPDANVLGTQSTGESFGSSDFAIRQAYIALRVPLLPNGLDFKVGVFDSIIGYESVESGANPNYTRSYGHSFEPQTHTGVLASYRICDMVTLSGGIANTKGPRINGRAFPATDLDDNRAESSKTYMGSIAITAPDSMSFLAGSTLYGGIVSGFDENEGRADYDGNTTSYYAGCTLATPVTGLRFGGAFDYLDVAGTSGETWSLAGYASFQATEKLSVHARAEYLRDRGAQKFFVGTDPISGNFGSTNPDKVLALTGTVQYDLWKNVISRVELRWDHSLSGERVWGGSTVDTGEGFVRSGGLLNEFMLAANIIYKF